MRRLGLLLVLFLSGCELERAYVPPPVRIPSCDAPLCPVACACDQTTTCDQSCDCDPECGLCHEEGGLCRLSSDAGGGDAPAPDATALAADAAADAGGSDSGADAGSHDAGGLLPDLARCTADAECMSGACAPGVGQCRSSPGAACTLAVGCADGGGERYGCDTRTPNPRCVPLTGATGGLCLQPSDCSNSLCVDSTCRAQTGDTCSAAEDCASEICTQTVCACSPFVSSTCPVDQLCAPNGCIPAGGAPLGGECVDPSDCARPGLCAATGPGEPSHCLQPCDEGAHPCTRPSDSCYLLSLGGLDVPYGICAP